MPPLKDEFDPRGGERKDKTGRGSKQAVAGCRLSLSDGEFSLRHALITGHFWMNQDHTRIEIPIQGRVKLCGEWKPNADYLAVVTGRRLEVVFDQLNEEKRVSVHPSTEPANEQEPHVERIWIEPLAD